MMSARRPMPTRTAAALGAVAALLLSLAPAAPTQAQVVALGSTATGGTSQVGRELAAAVSNGSPVQMRPQELANTADYIPLVNAGEMEFGISNLVQYAYAVSGTGMSEGRPHPDLRMVAVLMPFRNNFIVRADSGIETLADLKGKRMPMFPAGALGDHVVRGYLANAGMTVDDIVPVDVPNFPRMWASFAEGSTDVTIVVVGAGNSREFHATLGGIRYLPLDPSPEAMARLQEWLPGAYAQQLDASANIPGIDAPVHVNVFDYVLWASKDVSDEVVHAVTKALFDQAEALAASGPVWAGFEGARMALDVGSDYHPGALRFYREAGVLAD